MKLTNRAIYNTLFAEILAHKDKILVALANDKVCTNTNVRNKNSLIHNVFVKVGHEFFIILLSSLLTHFSE